MGHSSSAAALRYQHVMAGRYAAIAAALDELVEAAAALTKTPPSASILGGVVVPIAVAVAIFKYRLYDIDRIINRTVVYGLLTALLGSVYAAVVLLLGQLFGGIRGEPPSWVVAGATLAVAALFQPARHRIQAVVDRRFNRRKYDAAQTVETFSARLRDQLNLDTLAQELLCATDLAMEATTVSLWLRPPDTASKPDAPRWNY